MVGSLTPSRSLSKVSAPEVLPDQTNIGQFHTPWLQAGVHPEGLPYLNQLSLDWHIISKGNIAYAAHELQSSHLEMPITGTNEVAGSM
jgi:hypothetical protein